MPSSGFIVPPEDVETSKSVQKVSAGCFHCLLVIWDGDWVEKLQKVKRETESHWLESLWCISVATLRLMILY